MRQVAARAGGQLGVDRTTLLNHVGPARAAGFAPGGPPMGEGDWRTLVTGWFPELSDTGLATIHQRLSDERGLDASVASVRRWVRANLPEDARRAQVAVLRDTPPPGSEGQIDYGN
jgi:hypothetical protein